MFILPADRPLRVLAIGAHPDDIEIGAGGFIARLVRDVSAHVDFLVLTHGLQGPQLGQLYSRTQRTSETQKAADQLGITGKGGKVYFLSDEHYKDCRLHEVGHDLIKQIEQRVFANDDQQYDLVLSHAADDSHQDHCQAHESTVSALREFRGTLLLYQAPSTKPHKFHPTFFVTLDDDAIYRKDIALMCHISQRDKPELTGIVRTQGMAKTWALFLRLPAAFLEAFEVYKSFWNLAPPVL
ncbi:MAG: PIG-L family deacetylase [Bryobacteraceae bacterium]|nr:PIG-L family deacetylase [Bryobacteraceae bacterium]